MDNKNRITFTKNSPIGIKFCCHQRKKNINNIYKIYNKFVDLIKVHE